MLMARRMTNLGRLGAGLLLCLMLALARGPAVSAAGTAYTALGDSYSSGVGTRDYYSDSGGCDRSPDAYPVLAAAREGLDLTFAACSGATTTDVLDQQLASLSASTAVVTISAGGDDAGFSSVIEQCALPWPFTCTSQISSADTFITGTLPGLLDTLYAKIRSLAPNAHVIVVGYPRLFNGDECNALSRISPQEQTSLNQSADLLGQTTQTAAGTYGFTFVDARPAFTGHAVCSSDEWINGLSDPVSESYHPNIAGQQAYATLVQAAMAA
ncbi:MAG TPA: SGNH/GDSL hydrolase family protein [Candidatus Dormibacteraeota bacterium]|nr:SGNH/GDSL hydrolase family protein [Candidatus Dormibacteraeota bacterium]